MDDPSNVLLMLETAGHEAAHFVVARLSKKQRAILRDTLPPGASMPNALEDLVERIGCRCARMYRGDPLAPLSPEAEQIIHDILRGRYVIRRDRLGPRIMILALAPVIALKLLMVSVVILLLVT